METVVYCLFDEKPIWEGDTETVHLTPWLGTPAVRYVSVKNNQLLICLDGRAKFDYLDAQGAAWFTGVDLTQERLTFIPQLIKNEGRG